MQVKKRLLWIASNTPYDRAPAAGGQTFNYYFKRFANDESFDVRLVCWGDINNRQVIEKDLANTYHDVIYTEPSFRAKIKKISNIESSYNPWNKRANLISNYCANQIIEIIKRYKAEAFSPDIIILEWTNIVVMAKEIKEIFPNSKLVASEHDVTYIGYERKKNYYKGVRKLIWEIKYQNEKKIELKSLSLCDLVMVHNKDNHDCLVTEGLSGKNISWLVPYYHDLSHINSEYAGKDIIFFGAMSRPENYLSAEWFIENVLPMLQNEDVRFVVIGSKPPEELKKLANDRICITGYVEDFSKYFESALCLVAPLVLGAGIKVKILEALSSGIPVLTKDIGIEGIPANDKQEYFYCVSPGQYADTIKSIIRNPADRARISNAAKKLIDESFDLNMSFNNYRDLLLE